MIRINLASPQYPPIKSTLDPNFKMGEVLTFDSDVDAIIYKTCYGDDCYLLTKIIPTPNICAGGKKIGKFLVQNEIMISELMSEANIGPTIYDKKLDDQEGALVMFKYDGTLADLMFLYQDDNSIPIEDILNLVEQMIQKIHDKGVVHFDLKADNIFYTESGSFVIGDYGQAFFVDKNMENLESLIARDFEYLGGIRQVYQKIVSGTRFETPFDIVVEALPQPTSVDFLFDGKRFHHC